jgi:hypothetical protein
MTVKVSIFGKFDKVGEQMLEQRVVAVPAEVPVRWTIKVLGFIRVTIVGRVKVEPA